MKGLFFGLALGLVACSPLTDAFDRDESSVSAVIAISDRLQKEEDLLYRLLCTEASDVDLAEVARIAVLKGTAQTDLTFELDHALEIDASCRLEIRALSAGVYAPNAAYEFLTESDLYYISTKAPLLKAENSVGAAVDAALYKVYRDLNFDNKPIATELSFPAATEDTFKMKLICAGDKTYAAMATITAAAPLYKTGFSMPYKDLAEPLSCTGLTAVNGDESVKLEVVFPAPLEISKNVAASIVAQFKPFTPPPADSVTPETL